MEPLTGFPDCEVGAFRPASGEVPVTGVCGEFDTKRWSLISWRIDQPFANDRAIKVATVRWRARRTSEDGFGGCGTIET